MALNPWSSSANTYTYILPKHDAEYGRLDVQGQAINKMIGGSAFIYDLEHGIHTKEQTFKALDIGCGSGATTRELAIQLQSTNRPIDTIHVYGVDLEPVPTAHEQPSNVDFVQGNIGTLAGSNTNLGFETFDFVFHRMLLYGIKDWLAYIRICFSLLKSGGCIELQDVAVRWFNLQGNEISQNWQWLNLYHKTAKKIDLDLLAGEHIRKLMLEVGFVDVEEKSYAWHYSAEPWEEHPELNEMGHYSSAVLCTEFPKLIGKIAKMADMDDNELQEIGGVQGLQKGYVESTSGLPKGSHVKYYVICGRKP